MKNFTTSLMRRTFKNLKKIPWTNTKNLSPRPHNIVDLIISKKQRTNLTQKNCQPPDLRAQIKLHKPSQPVRPAVNNRDAPANKMSKLLVNKLNNLHLRNHNIVKDSTALAKDLTQLKIDKNHRMITFDIKDLYVNIPIQETHTYLLHGAESYLRS